MACAAGRALRRVTPCPTAPPAGIAASGDGAAEAAGEAGCLGGAIAARSDSLPAASSDMA